MKIDTKCTNCGKEYEVEESYSGQSVNCQECGKEFVINPLPKQEPKQTTAKRFVASPKLPTFNSQSSQQNDDFSLPIPTKRISPSFQYHTLNKTDEFPLSRFSRKALKVVLEVVLWITLIASPIVGAIIGYGFGDVVYGFFGMTLGLLNGFIAVILIGGYSATFFNLDNTNEEILKEFEANRLNSKK